MAYLNSNNYLLNIIPLFNVADTGAGDGIDTAQLATNVSNVQQMVNYTTKTLAADVFTPFTGGTTVSLQGDFAVTGSFSINGNSLGNVGGNTVLSNASVSLISGTNSLALTSATTSTLNAMTMSVNTEPVIHVTGSGQVAIGTNRLSTLSTLFDVYGDMYAQELHVSSYIHCVQVFQSSDERIKSNVRPLEGSALDKVCALQGLEYVIGGRPSLGLLAQDVQRIVPSAVDESRGQLYVDYSQLIPLLIEAIKELRGGRY